MEFKDIFTRNAWIYFPMLIVGIVICLIPLILYGGVIDTPEKKSVLSTCEIVGGLMVIYGGFSSYYNGGYGA